MADRLTDGQYIEHFSEWMEGLINQVEAAVSMGGFSLSRREIILGVQQQVQRQVQERYMNDPERLPVDEWNHRLGLLQECFDRLLRKANN